MSSRLPSVLLRAVALRGMAVALAALAVVLFVVFAPGVHRALEEAGLDPVWRWAAKQSSVEEQRVVVVRIDEDSLARVGSWPWPREQMAALVGALHREGAAVQLIDIVFPEAREGDAAFVAALQSAPAHLGQVFAPEPDAVRVGMLGGALPNIGCHPLTPVAGGYVANQSALVQAPGIRAPGHLTPIVDRDGTVRRIPPVLCHQQRSYAALGLLGVSALDGHGSPVAFETGRGLLSPVGWVTLPELGIRIPVDADGTSRLPYRLPGSAFASVSAADVLSGRVPAGLLQGVVALVGATAFGLGDTIPTPLAPSAAGVEIHARVVAAALDEAFIHTPRAAPGLQAGLVLPLLGLLVWVASRQRHLPSHSLPVAGVICALLIYGGHAVLLLQAGVWLGWLAPAAVVLLASLALSVAEFTLVRRERARLFRNLSSYLPEQVAAQIALREPAGIIDAERREVTVLFADLRNFSAYCEARPPEEAAALLHVFFAAAHRVVTAHGGVVEEFVGDAVMALWNAPNACPDHPACALRAAYALLDEVGALLPDTVPPGLEPLALGIGLETGKALVGSFGAAERRTHAALGETVTVAARLQAMSADLSSDIVVGPGAAARLPEAGLVDVGSFLLEGLQLPRVLHIPAPRAEGGQEEGGQPRIRLVA